MKSHSEIIEAINHLLDSNGYSGMIAVDIDTWDAYKVQASTDWNCEAGKFFAYGFNTGGRSVCPHCAEKEDEQ